MKDGLGWAEGDTTVEEGIKFERKIAGGVGWAGGATRDGGATVTDGVAPGLLGSRCASSICSASPLFTLAPDDDDIK